MSLEQQIDDLYKGPLAKFVEARRALAKSLTGETAQRVKRLQKPTVVPWAINQVYWHARPVYDRLAEAGEKLRVAQVAALKGRAGDVRRATAAHRNALVQAVAEAQRRAAAGGVKPNPEELARTLEAVSLARELPEPPGRLTKALRPAGFEALAGVAVKPGRRAEPAPAAAKSSPPQTERASAKAAAAERTRAAAERRRQKEVAAATKSVARAKTAEERARHAWERAKRELATAEVALSALK